MHMAEVTHKGTLSHQGSLLFGDYPKYLALLLCMCRGVVPDLCIDHWWWFVRLPPTSPKSWAFCNATVIKSLFGLLWPHGNGSWHVPESMQIWHGPAAQTFLHLQILQFSQNLEEGALSICCEIRGIFFPRNLMIHACFLESVQICYFAIVCMKLWKKICIQEWGKLQEEG